MRRVQLTILTDNAHGDLLAEYLEKSATDAGVCGIADWANRNEVPLLGCYVVTEAHEPHTPVKSYREAPFPGHHGDADVH